MKKLYSLCALVFAASLAVTAPTAVATEKHHNHQHHTQGAEATHACPMNPSVTGQAGDECPKCGMKLEPIAADNEGHACAGGEACKNCPKAGKHRHGMMKHHGEMKHHGNGEQGKVTHACPMNPSITGQAGDECPKCGMKLEPIDGYACPMHPKVEGQLGDECPKCGMKLTKAHGGHHH